MNTSLLVSVLSRVVQYVTCTCHIHMYVYIHIHACIAACGNEPMAEACSYTDLSGSDGEGL